MTDPTSLSVWGEEFERLLDQGLCIFCPRWTLPRAADRITALPDLHLGWRCNSKRGALAAALDVDPDMVRDHRSFLLKLIMHDLNPSFNRFLIKPMAKAVGLHVIHESIIDFMEKGTLIEKFGAARAWYSAQPGLHYLTVRAYDKGDPSLSASMQYSEWMELWPRYKDACRGAVASCVDPGMRHRLAEDIKAFSEIRSIG